MLGLAVYLITAAASRNLRPNDFALSILADQHLVSGYKRYRVEMWAVTYPLIALSMLVLLLYCFGWDPVAYLFFSSLFATGFLHPLAFGLLLSNSHFHGHQCYQPSLELWLGQLADLQLWITHRAP